MAILGASAVALDLLDGSAVLQLHSQFASGVNLACRGYLVYAGTDPHGGVCALRVDAADLELLRESPTWRWNGKALVGRHEHEVVALGAATVRYTVEPPTVACLASGDPRRLGRARAAVARASWFDSGLGREVGLPRLRAAVAALVAGGHDLDPVRAVVGLGAGLTPSGDDGLVGAMCVLAAAGRPCSEVARRLEAWLDGDGAQATTDVSASYLRLALEGAFSTPLSRLVSALADGVPDTTLDDAVSDLATIGATSGMDAAVGAQVAWEALVAAPPARTR